MNDSSVLACFSSGAFVSSIMRFTCTIIINATRRVLGELLRWLPHRLELVAWLIKDFIFSSFAQQLDSRRRANEPRKSAAYNKPLFMFETEHVCFRINKKQQNSTAFYWAQQNNLQCYLEALIFLHFTVISSAFISHLSNDRSVMFSLVLAQIHLAAVFKLWFPLHHKITNFYTASWFFFKNKV